jgi:hypothetical protein
MLTKTKKWLLWHDTSSKKYIILISVNSLDLASPEAHHPVCTYTTVLQHQLPLLSDSPPMKWWDAYHHQTISLHPDGWMNQRGGPGISQVSSSILKNDSYFWSQVKLLVYAEKTTQKGEQHCCDCGYQGSQFVQDSRCQLQIQCTRKVTWSNGGARIMLKILDTTV